MGQRNILFKQAKYWEDRSHSCLKALHATLTATARHAELRSHTAKAAWCWNGIKSAIVACVLGKLEEGKLWEGQWGLLA